MADARAPRLGLGNGGLGGLGGRQRGGGGLLALQSGRGAASSRAALLAREGFAYELQARTLISYISTLYTSPYIHQYPYTLIS
jgi:hypothetical protein